MRKFELPSGTQVKLVKTTPHQEFNGPKERKQAISLRLRSTLSLAILRQFSEHAPDALVRRRDDADTQAPVEGVAPVVMERVAPTMVLPLGFDDEFTGYTVTIDRAVEPLELYGCSVGKIKVVEVTAEGSSGTGVIEWSIGSDEKIAPEVVGLLCSLEASDIWIGQKAPEKPAEDKAARKARERQAAAEAAGQQRIDDAGTTTPEQALAAAVAGDPKPGEPERGENWPFPTEGKTVDPPSQELTHERLRKEPPPKPKAKPAKKTGKGARR